MHSDGGIMSSKTNAIDKIVGARVEQRRCELGIDLVELASALDIDPMTLRSYETGAKRLDAHVLQKIRTLLEVSVTFFFEPIDEAGSAN
jgi:transcriptional regulator with XRE-family HTH domain